MVKFLILLIIGLLQDTVYVDTPIDNNHTVIQKDQVTHHYIINDKVNIEATRCIITIVVEFDRPVWVDQIYKHRQSLISSLNSIHTNYKFDDKYVLSMDDYSIKYETRIRSPTKLHNIILFKNT